MALHNSKMTLLMVFVISLISMQVILATNTMPELKKDVLNFRYRANFKYERDVNTFI